MKGLAVVVRLLPGVSALFTFGVLARGGFTSLSTFGSYELAAVLLLLVMPGTGAVHATPNQTTVSLTFDDGTAAQYVARSILASHSMHGTFYVNSAKVGTDNSYYMTWPQIHDLANDGNEIGGHTAFHVNLTQADAMSLATNE